MISVSTNAEDSSDPLLIKVDGIVSHDFHVELNSNGSTKFFYGDANLFLVQGNYYSIEGEIGLTGTVIDGLFFGDNNSTPPDLEAFASSSIALNPDEDNGHQTDQYCDPCEIMLSNHGDDAIEWSYGLIPTGGDLPGGGGTVDPNFEGGPGFEDIPDNDSCECLGENLIELSEENCFIEISNVIIDSDLPCTSISGFEWTITPIPGADPQVIFEHFGLSNFPIQNIPPFKAHFPGEYQLTVYCEDLGCYISSESIQVDCGGVEDCSVNTAFFATPDACISGFIVFNCNSSIQTTWYEADENYNIIQELPSLQNQFSVQSFEEISYYLVEVFCGTCDPITIIFANSCDNCENNISITSSLEEIELSDYCLPIPDACLMDALTIEDDNNNLINLFGTSPFANSYCINSARCPGGGGEGGEGGDGGVGGNGTGNNPCSSAPSIHVLPNDLNTWLSTSGFLGVAQIVSSQDNSCDINSPSGLVLEIIGTDVNFESGHFIGTSTPLVFFEQVGPYSAPNGNIVYTLNNVCPGAVIEWNNGESGISATYPSDQYFDVSVSCPNECEYDFEGCLDPGLNVTQENETEEVCDYCLKANDGCEPQHLVDIQVVLPDGSFYYLSNASEFSFHYCLNPATSQCSPAITELMSSINDWLTNNDYEGTATYYPANSTEPSKCNDGRSAFIEIENSDVQFLNFEYECNDGSISPKSIDKYDCELISTGVYHLTANNTCTNPTYLWSTGETTEMITVTDEGSYEVTLACDGCVFNQEYIISLPVASAQAQNSIITNQVLSTVNFQDKNGSENLERVDKFKISDNISQPAKLYPEIKIFPNPTNNKLFANFKGFKYGNKYNISLFDSQGRMLKKFQGVLDSNNSELDVSDILNGMYMLKISVEDQLITTNKVIIIK